MTLTKEEAAYKIHQCAIMYNDNLLNKNILFLSICNNKSYYFESAFFENNFKHLTGVEGGLEPALFFNAALNNKLGNNDIKFKKDGTSELKINVLPKLMNIHLNARMIGDYDYGGVHLVADKLAGTTTSVMGFIQRKSGYYIPNTVLKDNLANIAIKPYHRVLSTFIKPFIDDMYSEVSYITKDISLITIDILKSLQDKVDYQNLKATFPIPWDNELLLEDISVK
jgi:hypothetical protein